MSEGREGNDDGGADPRRRRVRAEPTPTQRALGLLTRREHSRKELTRKLTQRGVPVEEASDAVSRLADAGWQNDERFAELVVRSRASAGYGPLRIRAELATHGLDRDAIAAAFESFEGDWADIAREQVRRRFGAAGLDAATARRKAADFLIRRGFDGDTGAFGVAFRFRRIGFAVAVRCGVLRGSSGCR